ncbi:hypothetical protein [Terasakiella sp. SH-1]|uniref:hypothetical protein n=1 Tax=Terasakiella sp. SH-1 TaxID=2560057 RepID=UPI0010744585|nr:hypothetical protein [Terasakiella sp. SH-1]
MLAMDLVSDVNAYVEACDLDPDAAEKAHKRGVAKAQRIKRCITAIVGLIDDDDFALKADFQTIFEFIKGTEHGIEGVISLGKQCGALKRQKQNRNPTGKDQTTEQTAPGAVFGRTHFALSQMELNMSDQNKKPADMPFPLLNPASTGTSKDVDHEVIETMNTIIGDNTLRNCIENDVNFFDLLVCGVNRHHFN